MLKLNFDLKIVDDLINEAELLIELHSNTKLPENGNQFSKTKLERLMEKKNHIETVIS